MTQKWIQPLCLKSVLKNQPGCTNKAFYSFRETVCLCQDLMHYPPLSELSFDSNYNHGELFLLSILIYLKTTLT